MIDPPNIVDLLSCLKSTPNDRYYFVPRKKKPSKDPYRFMASIGYLRDDAIGIVLKTLTSQECVAPFYRPNKNAPKFNTHVWVFERQQPLTYDSTHKIVDIYIKVTIDFENHVTVISFHQKRNPLKGEKKHGKN